MGRKKHDRDHSTPKGVSFIAAGTRVDGDVLVGHELWVEGEVCGSIKANTTSATVFVARSGAVAGAVQAGNVQVQGEVRGDIKAEGVKLEKSARVIGDIHYSAIEIEPGAVVSGAMRRTGYAQDEATEDNSAPALERHAP